MNYWKWTEQKAKGFRQAQEELDEDNIYEME